jgi:hypothetical protein
MRPALAIARCMSVDDADWMAATIEMAARRAGVTLTASCDTHPKDGDGTKIAAPLVSGAVPHEDAGDAQPPGRNP